MSRSNLTFFLLIASFGILLAGCSSGSDQQAFDEFSFSDSDLATIHELGENTASSAASDSTLSPSTDGGEDITIGDAQVLTAQDANGSEGSSVLVDTDSQVSTPNVDTAKQKLYDSIRTAVFEEGGNIYRVNNPFLNVRASMEVTAPQVERINEGEVVTVMNIPNAGWAKVRLQDGKEGYVALRYIAKLTTEERLAAEKKQFEGKYYVNFAFLNIRKEPSTQAEKIGELPGQTIVKPLSMNKEWAKVSYEGKEGYVSSQYLEPFQPVFLVRQDTYKLPILQYNADDTASIQALTKHIASLKASGKKIVTLLTLYNTVLAQESKDARISPDMVALTIAGVNAKNSRQVSEALQAASVGATLFIQTKDIGLSGITEKTVLTLLANGNDLQSGGHTGDDLRSMTDSQVSLELGQSKKLLEELTKREVYVVAYPKGGTNDRIMGLAADRAYLFGVSESPDKVFTRSQFLRLPSFRVTSGMTPDDVVKLVK